MIAFGQCAYRANGNALSAVSTFTVHHHLVECGSNGRVESATDSTQSTDGLHLITYTFAAAAEDTFIHVAYDGSSHFPFAWREFTAIERHFTDIEAQGEVLQFAVTAFGTGKAFVRVVGKNEFRHYFAGIHHAERAGVDYHTFRTTGGTGRGKVLASFHFHNTDTAGCRVILDTSTLQVNMAKGRDVDTYFACSFQNGTSFGHGYKMVVYLQGYLFFFHSCRF